MALCRLNCQYRPTVTSVRTRRELMVIGRKGQRWGTPTPLQSSSHRRLVLIDQGKVTAFSRHGRDWTSPYRRVDDCGKLGCKAALIDGEVIVQDENGISDFDALRSAIYTAPHRLVFFAFDLLHLNSQDLRRTPLIERRAALCKLIEPDPRSPIQFSDHVDSDGARVF
jgi:bifunctional non-homologous end joining protein LigD